MGVYPSSILRKSEIVIKCIRYAVRRDPDNLQLRWDFARSLCDAGKEVEADFVEGMIIAHENDPLYVLKELDIMEKMEKLNLQFSGFSYLEIPKDLTWDYRRGFVEHLKIPADVIDHPSIPEMFKIAPIRHVTLQGVPSYWPAYLQTPLRSLCLHKNEINDCQLSGIINLVNGAELTWLSLAYNPITLKGVDALALAYKDGKFPHLTYVDLLGCRADPTEQLSYDHNVVTHHYLPQVGIDLEKKYGSLPWLYRIEYGKEREINRCVLADILGEKLKKEKSSE